MTMETREFLAQARLDAKALETWLEEGWLLPERRGHARRFAEIDLARAQLIADLQQLGVNDEAVPVVLDLVDQMHGLRRALRDILSSIHAQPETTRRRIVAEIRAVSLDRNGARARRGRAGGADDDQPQ
jgi:chaperone modulatory protein CbpM